MEKQSSDAANIQLISDLEMHVFNKEILIEFLEQCSYPDCIISEVGILDENWTNNNKYNAFQFAYGAILNTIGMQPRHIYLNLCMI